jgi:hypothetical protein
VADQQSADKAKYVVIVMTDAPGPTGQFVEVEDQDGRSIRVGKWLQRDDGYWALRISHSEDDQQPCPDCSQLSSEGSRS